MPGDIRVTPITTDLSIYTFDRFDVAEGEILLEQCVG